MFPRDEEYSCSASPTEWVLFIGSVWTIWASWWLLELVEMATQRGMPFKQRMFILNMSVRWNCTRMLAPAYVALMASSRAGGQGQSVASYYFGYEQEYRPGSIPAISPWQWVKIILMDLPPLLLQPALLAYSNGLYRQSASEPLLASHWVMSSTPAALTGLFLIVTSSRRLQAISSGHGIFWLTGILVAVGLAFILVIYFLTEEGHRLGWASAVPTAAAWALIVFPWQLKQCCKNFFHVLLYCLSSIVRMMPLLTDMVTGGKGFPFCGVNHIVALVVYGLLSWPIMWAAATAGGQGVETLCRKHWANRRQAVARGRRPWEEVERGDEDAVSLRSREGLFT